MPTQKKILLTGVVIVFLMALAPPWQRNGYPAGYRPIFVPPDGAVHIDLTRLLIPIFSVIMLTGVGTYLTKNPKATSALPPEQQTTPQVITITPDHSPEEQPPPQTNNLIRPSKTEQLTAGQKICIVFIIGCVLVGVIAFVIGERQGSTPIAEKKRPSTSPWR
jgi:hypothetical protein